MQHPDRDAVLRAYAGHIRAFFAVAPKHGPLLFQRDGQHRRLAGFVRIVQRLADARLPIADPIDLNREIIRQQIHAAI
jgi:hypothetical protein